MDIKELVRENLVLFSEADTKVEVLSQLADLLYEQGEVKNTFKNAVLRREEEFPTGLETEHHGIAIPHTDNIHVNQPAIAIGILEKKIPFIQMGSSDEKVKVELIFMLAIKEAADQLELLQLFVELIQNEKIVNKLKNSKNSNEVIQSIYEFSEISI